MKENIELLHLKFHNRINTEVHDDFMYKENHCHTYYEVELVVSGKGRHIINGHEYEEKEHDAYIMRLSDFHEVQLEQKGKHLVLEIPFSYITDDIEKYIEIVESDLITNLSDEEFEKALSIYNVINEYRDAEDEFHENLKKHLSYALIMYIIERVDKDISRNLSKSSLSVKDIIAYIQKNISSDLCLGEIAKKFYVSSDYLSAYFREQTGMSIKRYITKIRLDYAATLLITTDKKILEIAHMAGYDALSTFMRNFKDEYGVSASQMRKNNKK